MTIKSIFPYIFAAISTAFLIVSLSPLARKIGLVDLPDQRKHHKLPVPLIGGIAMVVSLVLSTLLVDLSLAPLRILFFCIGVLLITGILDDYKEISSRNKLLIQLVLALFLVIYGDFLISQLGDIFQSGEPQGLGFLATPFTVIAVVAAINAFNMSDGHDGLSGSLSLISLSSLVIILLFRAEVGDESRQIIILLAISVLIPFLFFNLPLFVSSNRQVFMGDAGSMVFGLIIAYYLVDFSQRDIPLMSPSAVPWLIALPILDMVSVIVSRIFSGMSPTKPDRAHLHHLLVKKGLSNLSVLFALLTTQAVFTLIGLAGTFFEWSESYLFFGFLLVVVIYFLLFRSLSQSVKHAT